VIPKPGIPDLAAVVDEATVYPVLPALFGQ
jgi:hypothetical protein